MDDEIKFRHIIIPVMYFIVTWPYYLYKTRRG